MGVVASSCSSSSKKYEVLLSFRGEDTRRSFTSHLYDALRRSGIETYIDDGIPKGDDISQSLIQAIENSSISVVIFSVNYASSKWCLNELTEILRCKQLQKQHVVPIFYQVDPSHVRNQKGPYEEAFAQHLKNYPEKVDQWRQALFEIASLGGWDSRVSRSDAELIQNIVNDIMQKLNRGSSSTIPNIVGIDENSNQIESLLKKFSIIGIWGMGGIGKTTMAKVIFAKSHSEFDSYCFIENLREESEKYGLKYIRDKLLLELSKDTTLGRLDHKKVFIVLDDVSNTNQLDYLQNEAPKLGCGSKVIIISRDRHVLDGRVGKIHQARELGYLSSHQLFNLKAFHKHDCENEYKELVDKAIAYAQGNPLALTTLGSFLYSKTVKEWESALRKLETTANQDIQAVLRLSYDGLDDEEKEIFLDIAFFLKGECTRYIMAVLESCGFHTSICLRKLVDKALISIDYVVHMHDLIQLMAFEIVRQECVKNPRGRSRLQKFDEVNYVLKINQGSDEIQGVNLDLSQIRCLELSADALKKMTNLRFLKFYSRVHKMSCTVHLPSGLFSFSNPLRRLQLDKFSSKSQPLSFCAEKLVALCMRGIRLKKLWDGVQNLVNLLSIDLAKSQYLMELPDLSMAQNLERLNIFRCQSLCHLHPSILSLPRLKYLELDYYTGLKSLTFNSQAKSFLYLCPVGCSSLKEVSVSSHELRCIHIEETGVEIWTFQLGVWRISRCSLNGLTLKNLRINETLSMRSLNRLLLNDCGGIIDKSKLHALFDASLFLELICLKGSSKLTELPNNIKHISRLRYLDVSDCKDLQSLPELPPSIETVRANNCISLETVPISITSAPQLKFLFLQNCLKLENHSLSRVMEWAYFSLKQSAHTKETGVVCYPGSKAPEWFTFSQETKGSTYVAIELPPSTNDLAGFIFCSVLSHVPDGCFSLGCRLYCGGKWFSCDKGFSCFNRNMEETNSDSHHVVLWCAPCPITCFIKTMGDKNTNYMPRVSFEFSIFSYDGGVGVIEACRVCPIYSSITGEKRHRNIDDEQQQPTPTKKWKKSSMLSSKSKATHDLEKLIFSLSQLNLECMKDNICQM